MRTALLVAIVAVTWLACLGYARLRTPLQRLHCSSFLTVTAYPLLAALAFAADGPSTRAVKLTLLAGAAFLVSAATSHAAGRALLYRARFDAED